MQNSKISSLQMAMLLYPTIIATGILTLPSYTARLAQNDMWLSPIIASLLGFLTVYIAISLYKLYPGQTVIQFSEQITGRFFGKIISFFILFFYIQTSGDIVRAYSEFIVTSFLFKTPMIVVIASMVLLCAFVVYSGIEVLGRVGQLFFPLFVVPIILFLIFLSNSFEPSNMFPILEEGIMSSVKGAVLPASWFSEFFLIIFLLPFLADSKQGMKKGMLTVLAVMLTLVVVNLIVLWILGAAAASKVYPLMNVSRYISVANFIENLESVTMAVWIVGVFVKLSVFFYAVVLGTAQWFNLSDYRPLVWPVGILIIQFSFWGIPNTMSFSRYDLIAFPFYAVLIQTVIPLLLLAIAVLRKRNSKEKRKLN